MRATGRALALAAASALLSGAAAAGVLGAAPAQLEAGAGGSLAGATADGGRVFVASDGGAAGTARVVAYNAGDGSLAWESGVGGRLSGGALVNAGAGRVAVSIRGAAGGGEREVRRARVLDEGTGDVVDEGDAWAGDGVAGVVWHFGNGVTGLEASGLRGGSVLDEYLAAGGGSVGNWASSTVVAAPTSRSPLTTVFYLYYGDTQRLWAADAGTGRVDRSLEYDSARWDAVSFEPTVVPGPEGAVFVVQIQGGGDGADTLSVFRAAPELTGLDFREDFSVKASATGADAVFSAVTAVAVEDKLVVAATTRAKRARSSGTVTLAGGGGSGDVELPVSGLPALTLGGKPAVDSDLIVFVVDGETGEMLGKPRLVGTADGADSVISGHAGAHSLGGGRVVYVGEFGSERKSLLFDEPLRGLCGSE